MARLLLLALLSACTVKHEVKLNSGGLRCECKRGLVSVTCECLPSKCPR